MCNILVVGSNKNNNNFEKRKAINLLLTANNDVEVYDSCSIYNSEIDSKTGNDSVLDVLENCVILYVVCSDNGYVGNATISKIGYAKALTHVRIYSSHKINDPDIEYFIDDVLTPEELIIELNTP